MTPSIGKVLVTGAGSGIGAGIAQVLASRGWAVAVNDRDAASARATAAHIGGIAIPGDVGSDAADIVARAADGLGGLTGLVNNAGIHRRAPLATVTAAQLEDVYRVNLAAAILGSQAALPFFSAGGAIVNTASIAAYTPQMQTGLYSAAKAGIVAFTAQAAVEWGPLNVRVNAVAPGMVRTAMAESVYADPALHAARVAMVPLRRIGMPGDIGHAVAFLLSQDASYITGQTLIVDGGFTHTVIDHLPHPAISAENS
jgi:NAD(P)-dependent dehydrogenase (short-subunit alcohol dehydrogenase family)